MRARPLSFEWRSEDDCSFPGKMDTNFLFAQYVAPADTANIIRALICALFL